MVESRPHWWLKADGLAISEQSRPLAVLRLRAVDADIVAKLATAFNVAWPVKPNTHAGDATKIYWMAPREWLIAGAAIDSVRTTVQSTCGSSLHHMADVSAGRTVFTLEGAHVRSLLAKSCSIDLYPKVFGASACAQTLLGQAHVLLAATPRGFEVIADVSFARYLRAWFEDAKHGLAA